VRSVKDEARSRLILFGERAVRHTLKDYVTHFHQERPPQGKGNAPLFPGPSQARVSEGAIQCHERLSGVLKYYYRQDACRCYADTVSVSCRHRQERAKPYEGASELV
jgi:hypothetical protein